MEPNKGPRNKRNHNLPRHNPLRRRDGGFRRVEGFRFENYEPEGTGPESLLAFVDACLGREHYNGADAAVGLQTVRCLDAMYRSAKSGKAEACAPGQ